jgi:hypothetical protein
MFIAFNGRHIALPRSAMFLPPGYQAINIVLLRSIAEACV